MNHSGTNGFKANGTQRAFFLMSGDARGSAAAPPVRGLVYTLLRTPSLKLKDPLSLFFLCKTNKRLLLQIRMEVRAAKDTKPKTNKAKNERIVWGVLLLFSVEGLLLIFMKSSSWRQ